jgi:hypothetical protein
MNMYDMKSYAREDEEALFSKVREMKESLINQDMKGSLNGRSSIAAYKYSAAETKSDHSGQFDPRVENIDKINSKIKKILSCL